MNILTQLYWFINSAATVVIVAVIALVILRLIANKANPNPFGWTSITIRRLTDPLIGPVRRALVGFGVDPKYTTCHHSSDHIVMVVFTTTGCQSG